MYRVQYPISRQSSKNKDNNVLKVIVVSFSWKDIFRPSPESTIKFVRANEAFVMRASTTAIGAALHMPRKEHPMHREIAYFPRDFIYLFHTSMTFPFVLLRFTASENRYRNLDATESSLYGVFY